MRNEKLWKRLAALVISAVLLIPAPAVSAAEMGMIRQEARTKAADNDGFVIKDGVLKKYTGDAEKLVIPSNVTSIGEDVFLCNESLKSIVIPKQVKSIGDSAFAFCENLTSVTLSEGLESIEHSAFYECTSLKSLSIPASLKTCGNSVFMGCVSLEELTLPEGLSMIGDCAFVRTGIKNLVIPGSIQDVEDRSFESCKNLKSVKISEGVTRLGTSAFLGCTSLEEVVIPGTVTTIAAKTFSFCDSLESITIPQGVKSLGNLLFRGSTKLKSVSIPESVTKIGPEDIFEGCEEVTIYGRKGSYAQTYAKENGIPFQAAEKISGCEITLEADSYRYDGKAKTPKVTVKDGEEILEEGTDYIVTYRDNINVGTGKVIIQGSGIYTGTAERTFLILEAEKKALSDCTITISPASYVYDGKAKTPKVTVKDKEEILKEGTDYTVAYRNNINAGTARVVLNGLGTYTGTVERTFLIQAPKRESQKLDYQKNYNKTYGDKPFKLNVKTKKGDGKLTYTSSDKKIVTVNSQGKATIKGTGLAVVTVRAGETAKYSAKSAKITIKVKPAKEQVKSLKVQKGKKLKISWKRDKRATGYEIQYSTDKKFKDKKNTKMTVVKDNKVTSKVVSKLKNGKKYYVRVRAYKNIRVNGKTQRLYGNWSDKKKSGKVFSK